MVSMPVMIPPVKEKSYDMFGGLFTTLWDQARIALTTVDHLIIIGYSFPPTDYASNQLFLDAFTRRKTIPRVTIIDPSPERVRGKLVYEFGIPEECLTIHAEYYSESFPIEKVLAV